MAGGKADNVGDLDGHGDRGCGAHDVGEGTSRPARALLHGPPLQIRRL